MDGREHKAEAERLLDEAHRIESEAVAQWVAQQDEEEPVGAYDVATVYRSLRNLIAAAQVHATLATCSDQLDDRDI